MIQFHKKNTKLLRYATLHSLYLPTSQAALTLLLMTLAYSLYKQALWIFDAPSFG